MTGPAKMRTPGDFAAALRGKTVAIVGNAVSLAASRHGPLIDACDIVIRLNRVPGARPESHGTRTTWLAISKLPSEQRLREVDPQVLIWMTPKNRCRSWALRLRGWKVFHYSGAEWASLCDRLGGARPSTGLMIIDFIARIGGFTRLRVFGFDFFESGSLAGRAADAWVPHVYAKERQHVEALIASGLPIEVIPPTMNPDDVKAPESSAC